MRVPAGTSLRDIWVSWTATRVKARSGDSKRIASLKAPAASDGSALSRFHWSVVLGEQGKRLTKCAFYGRAYGVDGVFTYFDMSAGRQPQPRQPMLTKQHSLALTIDDKAVANQMRGRSSRLHPSVDVVCLA